MKVTTKQIEKYEQPSYVAASLDTGMLFTLKKDDDELCICTENDNLDVYYIVIGEYELKYFSNPGKTNVFPPKEVNIAFKM